MISLSCFHFGCNRLEIGELGSFLDEVADGAFERLQAAVGDFVQEGTELADFEPGAE